MADNTKIEWTEATWNPIRARTVAGDGSVKTGWHCVHASEGCRNCYAESFNKRLGTGFDYKPGHLKSDVEVYLDEKMLLQPLKWKKARQIFVCSMTDLFADFVTDEMLDRIFAVMALCPQHTFQLLTKRSARMRNYCATLGKHHETDRVSLEAKKLNAVTGFSYNLGNGGWHLPNVWLGVSVENQAAADERIPDLLATPATLRWLSCEPLLGPVDLCKVRVDGQTEGYTDALTGGFSDPDIGQHEDDGDAWVNVFGSAAIDWVVAGGESGPHRARPMHPDWARSLRDQCAAADVPFFFKQWGEWARSADVEIDVRISRPNVNILPDGRVREWSPNYPSARLVHTKMHPMVGVGKKAAGRLLDGVLHNGMPA